ncbi:MAG: hypothetical protein HY909_18145, partial [Deltaproteobacteria bacterium]|nr:hypothetical protein [Deltaproteobacteria bacterium]
MPERTRRVYTAWHPLLVALLEHTLPEGYYQCLSEFQLSREPLRIDVVIVRRMRPGTPPAVRLLASVLDELAAHTLVHFKGPSDELEATDAPMLLAYALLYMVVAEVPDPGDLALRVVAPRLTPRFVASLAAMGCALTPGSATGTWRGRLGVFPLHLVEAELVSARPGEHLLYTVTRGMLADPDDIPVFDAGEIEIFWALREHVEQVRHTPPGTRRRRMKDQDKVVESFEKAMASLVKRLPIEQRLAGLAPEQRLAGLAPEQRLAGLAPEQRL